MGEQQDAFDTLIVELMARPEISSRVDQLVEQAAAKKTSDKNEIQVEIARLKEERGEWQDRVRKHEAEHRQLSAKTSKVVKAAFDKARIEGVSTLGELAVFQALLTSISPPSSASQTAQNNSQTFSAQFVLKELSSSGRDVVSTLKSLGVASKIATALAIAGETALKAGLMVCVSGVAARHAVTEWAGSIGQRGALLDATVGLIDDSTLKGVLAGIPPHDVVALLDANLSALDTYARPISDLVLSRVVSPDREQMPAIFLSLSDGVASLPLPKGFESVSISLNLDVPYVFRDVSDLDELMARAIDPEDGIFYSRLWRPAADRLRARIADLDPESRCLALAVLTWE